MTDPTPTPPSAVDLSYTTTELWQNLFFHLIAATVAISSLFGAHFNLDGPGIDCAGSRHRGGRDRPGRLQPVTRHRKAVATAAPTGPINPPADTENEIAAQVDGERTDAPIRVPRSDQSITSVEIVPSLLAAPAPDSPAALMGQSQLLADICVLLRRIYQEVMAIQKSSVWLWADPDPKGS